jgi:hypothetical protein
MTNVELAAELDEIRGDIDLASELPMTADPRRVVDLHAPLLLAAVEAVLELHRPLDRGTGTQCQGCATHVTYTPWPCPTYQAITAALTGKESSSG